MGFVQACRRVTHLVSQEERKSSSAVNVSMPGGQLATMFFKVSLAGVVLEPRACFPGASFWKPCFTGSPIGPTS